MPEAVFAHLFGTVALIAIMLSVSLIANIILNFAYFETKTAGLSEVAQAVARQMVDLVSVESISNGKVVYMRLKAPPTISGSPYAIVVTMRQGRLAVEAFLQENPAVMAVAYPNFGSNVVVPVNQTYVLPGGVSYGPLVYIPCNKPVIVVYRQGNTYYVGLGRGG